MLPLLYCCWWTWKFKPISLFSFFKLFAEFFSFFNKNSFLFDLKYSSFSILIELFVDNFSIRSISFFVHSDKLILNLVFGLSTKFVTFFKLEKSFSEGWGWIWFMKLLGFLIFELSLVFCLEETSELFWFKLTNLSKSFFLFNCFMKFSLIPIFSFGLVLWTSVFWGVLWRLLLNTFKLLLLWFKFWLLC